MQEACKLIWTRCLVAADCLSTPTLSNLPQCPFSSSDMPRLSAARLFFIYNFAVFCSVLLTTCVTAGSSRQSRGPFIEEDPGPPYRVVTRVTWWQQLLTYGTKPLQAEWFMSDTQAADGFGRSVYVAAIWKGILSNRPRERRDDLGL